ncbi:hypothetical protein [Pseudolysinimonas sp.]|uniref:hypothetical protein n=1 Tax=Pseudolysinimonas sp. TaxID=2680009 RepID=UPI00286B161C|nr:hypothetical protein [Pseudolysinimonas sp.]
MRLNKKFASLALAGALVAAGLSVASPAAADVIPGTITITPTSGNAADTYFLTSIATSVGGPVGYRAASTNQIFQNGVLVGNMSNLRTSSMASTYGTNGLDGNPAYMDRSVTASNNFVSNKRLNQLPTAGGVALQTGEFELRYYFHASSTSFDLVNDKYLTLTLYYDAATGNWGPPAAPATPTSVALTGSTTANAGEVDLDATVENAAGDTTLTAAAGDIVFKEGATTVATVPVANGVASALLTGVANGSHTYTAEFVPSNTVYSGSTSGSVTVQLGALQAPVSVGSNITVAIPTGVGNLYLTSYSQSVDLGTATRNGSTLDASGTLNAVVTDERQVEYPAWNLNGQVGDFTKAGGTVLDGKYLGWTPSVAVNTIGSTAGPVVAPAPGTTTGLKAVSLLATGAPSYNGTVTTASALLLLKAPVNTPAGAYSATLTLTLI